KLSGSGLKKGREVAPMKIGGEL
ncbi:hypothetical protein A2U01_0039720, partial [Trifolium medium]|nr:hypothetical protein [Trifolium medium]